MALHTRNVKLLFLTCCSLISLITLLAASQQVIHPDCEEYCGNVHIPYPFGTKNGCYLDDTFYLTCNRTFTPPKTQLGHVEVLNISIDGYLRILTYYSSQCFDPNGTVITDFYSSVALRDFPFSYTRNKFTAIGCDTYAVISDYIGKNYQTGCMSLCENEDNVADGVCSGIGCCQTAIPKELYFYNATVDSYYNHTLVSDFNPCSFSFLVEQDYYNFSIADLNNTSLRGTDYVPAVLDWAVGNLTCEEAQTNLTSFACQANSNCIDSDNGPGYRCYCSEGYQGNAYTPNGCQDIDECEDISNKCVSTSKCANTAGSYNCTCPKGYTGDGRSDGTGCKDIDECGDPKLNRCPKHCINTPGGYTCSDQLLTVKVSAGIGISLAAVIVGISSICWGLRKRKLVKLKEKFFEQNGGLVLQQLAQAESSANTVKIFSAEDLEKATNNYNDSMIVGKGGYGTVYKGILMDGSVVAIKKSRVIDETQIKQFISEVIVLCQINHRNVVKLLGCCLETQAPILVYEFVTNGTLFEHLHQEDKSSGLSWDIRLRIAAETAGVLAYLHSQASTPIVHRDIKSTNILLDEHFNAKVSDFGASRLVPFDELQICTVVQGTLGYLDPEYLHTSQLNEKSDVYSFGVMLAEMLTGQKALRFGKPEEERSLALHFLNFLKQNRLLEVVEERVSREGDPEQLKAVADLAKRCLSMRGEERPYMKEVAMELERLRITRKHPWDNVESNQKESVQLLCEERNICDQNSNNSRTGAYDSSLRDQIVISVHEGR